MYHERTKIKLKRKEKCKKVLFRETFGNKLSDIFVELLIMVKHAAIRILHFLVVFELWHFFYFLGFSYKISQKCLLLRKFHIFSKTFDYAS